MRAQVQLECGCEPYFTSPIPLLGDVLICRIHGESKRVTVEWFFQCQDCRYSRSVGDSPMTAEVKATSHAIRLHHRVKVWRQLGQKISDEFIVPPKDSQLVLELDKPPF